MSRDGPWLYGHNWVCVAMLLRHRCFGVMALPLLSNLYVRKIDVAKLQRRYGWKFESKHQLAWNLVSLVMAILSGGGCKAAYVVVFDGAYAVRQLISPLIACGAVVVTRLRRDAKLFDLPAKKTGGRGRPPLYGKNRISLAKRAGRREGWQTVEYCRRGVMVEGRYKTFLATRQLAGGVIRVVPLQHSKKNWAAYLSTDASLSIQTILETVSDRWAIEEQFHDVKEIWGAGEQQIRNVWSNIGCWNLCTWLYALVELASWDESMETLVDRSDRRWDNPLRRPSHTDRRRRIAREMLRHEFLTDAVGDTIRRKIQKRIDHLLNLAA